MFYNAWTDSQGNTENDFQVVARMVKDKWNIDLKRVDISNYHRLPGGGFIIHFKDRTPESAFYQIATADPKMNPKIKLSAHVRLSEKDLMFQRQAKMMVEDGKAEGVHTDPVFGKVCLRRNGGVYSIFNHQDLEKFYRLAN